MEETITCPNCGEINPADMAYCQNCQWRLRPLGEEGPGRDETERDTSSQASTDQRPSDASVPDWLKGLAPAPPLRDSVDEATAQQLREQLNQQDADNSFTNAPRNERREDLLAGLGRAEAPDDEAIPDWVARIMGISEGDDSAPSLQSRGAESSNFGAGSYLDSSSRGLGRDESLDRPEDGGEGNLEPSRDPGGRLDSSELAADAGVRASENSEIYEWLRKLDADGAAPPLRQPGKDVPATTDVPTWVGRMMSVTGEDVHETDKEGGSVPGWLSESPRQEESPLSAPHYDEPENVASTQSFEVPAAQPVHEVPAPPAPIEPARSMPPQAPFDDPDTLDVDAVFAAMQIPQWAAPSDTAESGPGVSKPPAAQSDEKIELAALPSWVQALRPVEPAAPTIDTPAADRPRESAGPLLGLEGVLPAVRGAAIPTIAPKSHAIRLEVTERHRADARFIEGLLDAETVPLPLPASNRLSSPRLARWAIGAALFMLVIVGLTAASTSFAFPSVAAAESSAALQAVQAVPPDAAVLAIFDYEPASAGEMEAVAAALMDQLLLLKHPRVALLSTSPTGSALAERFMDTTLRERGYTRGIQYANLGFLPGGLSGVQLFAQQPVSAITLDAAAQPAWNSAGLQGITTLADFAATILLTDSLERGGVWIEQTTGRRGSAPLIIIASAQAGPMLLPYFDSGQIQGLVVGIHGASATELANGGRPGLVRQYWDAYNLGLYLAALLIVTGALWQVASRLRRPTEAA